MIQHISDYYAKLTSTVASFPTDFFADHLLNPGGDGDVLPEVAGTSTDSVKQSNNKENKSLRTKWTISLCVCFCCILLILAIVILTLFQLPESSECHYTIPTNNNLPFVRSSDERHNFETIIYFCNDLPNSPVHEEWQCLENLWTITKHESCDCLQSPPAPVPPNVYDWADVKTQRLISLGTTVSYFCLPEFKLKNKPYEIKQCVNNKTWSVIKSISSCENVTALCTEDPPKAVNGTISDWNHIWYRVGTLVQHYCSTKINSKVKFVYVCDVYLQWTKVFESICDCDLDPPLPTERIYREWDRSHASGTVVTYFCEPNLNSSILLTYVCDGPDWKLVFRAACRIKKSCLKLPPFPQPRGIIQQVGTNAQIGSSLVYYCHDKPNSKIYRTVVCNEFENWVVVLEDNCTTECNPIKKIQNQHCFSTSFYLLSDEPSTIGAGIIQSCVAHKNLFLLMPFYQSSICSTFGTWEIVVKKSCSKTLPYRECNKPIPQAPPGTFLSWQLKQITLGSTLQYVCAKHVSSAIAASYACSDYGKWVSTQPNTSCICQDQPPLPKSFLYRILKPQDHSVNSQYIIYCYYNPDSPIFMIITCTPQLFWTVDELSTCTCRRPPPAEYPIISTWNPEIYLFHLGSRVTYNCNAEPNAKTSKVLECKSKYTSKGSRINIIDWEKVLCIKCPRTPYVCKSKPRLPSKYLNWDWMKDKEAVIGSLITYYCRNDRSRVWMTSLCTSKGIWEEKYFPHSCGCMYDPPLPPPGISRSWDEGSNFGATVYFTCVGLEQTRVLRTLVCNTEGSWVEAFRGSCRQHDYACCVRDHPKIPINSKFVMWKNTNISGSTIKILCPKKSKSDNELAVESIYVCEAITLKWKLVSKADCPCDEPLFYSFNTRTVNMLMRWNSYSTIGSVVKYMCHPSETPSPGVIMQCRNSSWTEIYQGACKCFEEPKPPSLYSIRIWDKASFIGSNITYRCSNDKGAPIEQIFTCYPNGQWIPKMHKKHNCDCESPPEAPVPAVWNWEGNNLHMGVIIIYQCNHEAKSPQIIAIKCTADLNWTVISTFNWTNDFIKFKESVKYSHYHTVSAINPIPAKAGRLDMGKMTTVCYNVAPVGSHFKDPDWAQLMSCRCDCLDEPPQFPNPIVSDWKRSISLTYYYGTSITYWCNVNSEVYIIITCRGDRLWRSKKSSPYNTCICLGKPTEDTSYKHYPVHQIWPKMSRHLGTKVEYRCSHTPNAPLLVQYECTYRHETKRNEWIRNINRAMSICICTCGLPQPPMRTPPLQIVPQWTYGENKNELVLWSGSRYEYRCGNDVLAGIYQVVECGADSCWQIVDFIGKCVECMGDPPTGPGIRNWDGSRLIGTIATYQCSIDINSMHVMDYECSTEIHEWVRVYNGSCECRAFPEMPPLPLKLQVDWLSPTSRHMGIKHIVTCSTDENSPVVDTIECDAEGKWTRNSNYNWTTLLSQYCTCSQPPEITAYYEFHETYYIGDEINFHCGPESDAALRRIFLCANQRLWVELLDNAHACMCLTHPPIADHMEFRDWNGSREIGTEIDYRCTIHLPYVKETVKCMSSGEWHSIQYDESACICIEHKPVLPAGKDEVDMRWDHGVDADGIIAITRLHCNAYNSSPIFAELICNKRGEWFASKPDNLVGNILDDHFWNMTYMKSCYCNDDSLLPTFENISVFILEPTQSIIGSQMIYLCNEDNAEKFLQRFECTADLKWIEIEIPDSQKCSCVEEPPPVPKYTTVIRDWNKSRFYGTEVTYYCTKENKTIFQIVQCSANGTWIYTLPPDPFASCDCSDPPLPDPDHRREWQGSRITGSKATYMCSDNANDTALYNHAYRVYECSIKRKWELIVDNDCQCPRELPQSSLKFVGVLSRMKHPPHRQVGGQVHGKCSDAKVSPEVLIYTCHTNMTWIEADNVEELVNKTCYCPEKLPTPLDLNPSPFMNWTGGLEIGESISFHCSTSQSPIFETYHCTPDGKWTKSHTADDIYLYNIHCQCSPPPPLSEDLPKVVRVETKINSSIGSKFSERCTEDPLSPMRATYECSPNKTWKKTILSPCMCDTLPAGFPDFLYANWTKPTPPGGKLKYYCAKEGGFVVEYQCSKGLAWRNINSVHKEEWDLPEFVTTYCKCEKPFPKLDPHYFIVHNETQTEWIAGDKLPIKCSSTSKVVVSHNICLSKIEWKVTPLLTDDLCSCSTSNIPKPNEPYYVETLNTTVIAPNDVIFYCSNKKPLMYKFIVQCSDPNTWHVKLHEKPCKCSVDEIEDLSDTFQIQNDSHEVKVGSAVNIQCAGFKNPKTVHRFWCVQNGVWIKETDVPWEDIAEEFCECPIPPEAPKELILTPHNASRKIDTNVNHQCTSNPLFGSSKIFTCTEKSNEYGVYWKETSTTSCVCEDHPAGGTELNDWDRLQFHLGTVIHYYCGDSVDTPIKYNVTCIRTAPEESPKWVRDQEDNVCECEDKPITPDTSEFYIHYPEDRFVGSTAKLTCSKNPNSNAVGLFYCNSDGEWIRDLRGEKKLDKDSCKCPPFKNPHPEHPVKFTPNDTEKHYLVGAIATVYCTEGHEPFLTKLKCNTDKKWEEVEISKCECPPLPKLPDPQKIYPNKDSKNPLVIGQSHPVTCNDLNQLEFHNHITCTPEKEWKFQEEHLCFCSTPPPGPTSKKLHLQWNELQVVGTVANYTCSQYRTSPTVVSVTCKFGDIWSISTDEDQDQLVEEECTCLMEPPNAEPHLARIWNIEDKHIGDEARYECSSGSVDYVYRCNMKRQWEKVAMGFCECRTDLPAIPPATNIVTSKYQGAVAHFLCSSDPKQGLYRDYRCNRESRWELTNEYSCQCNEPPPTPPSEIYFYDITIVGMSAIYYVGAERRYFCSHLSNSKMIRNAVCVSPSPRANKEWEYSDKNTSTWDDLTEDCRCYQDPPHPHHNSGWNWDGINKQEGNIVNYYCLPDIQFGPVIAYATCNAEKKWEMNHQFKWNELIESQCGCGKLPELHLDGITTSWESVESHRIGSIVTYWCNEEQTEFHVRYQCDGQKNWTIIEIGNCDKDFCSIHHNSTTVMCLSVIHEPLMFLDQELTCKLKDSGLVQIKTEEDNKKIVKCSYPAPSTCKNYFFSAHYRNRTTTTGQKISTSLWSHWVRQHGQDEDCAVIDSNGKWIPTKCEKENCAICEEPAENNLYFNCPKASDLTSTKK